jgi:hypothetical protein
MESRKKKVEKGRCQCVILRNLKVNGADNFFLTSPMARLFNEKRSKGEDDFLAVSPRKHSIHLNVSSWPGCRRKTRSGLKPCPKGTEPGTFGLDGSKRKKWETRPVFHGFQANVLLFAPKTVGKRAVFPLFAADPLTSNRLPGLEAHSCGLGFDRSHWRRDSGQARWTRARNFSLRARLT